MHLKNNLATSTTWDIHETLFKPEQLVTTGSNYMIGNGYLGYRGTFADDRADQYVACVLTDTYDRADGKWKELVTVPNGLFTEIKVDGTPRLWRDEALRSASSSGGDAGEYRRTLNFRYGEWSAHGVWADAGVTVTEERFAGYADRHLVTARTRIKANRAITLEIRTGIDGHVWSLNGDHFASLEIGSAAEESRENTDQLEARAATIEHRYDVVVRELSRLIRDGDTVVHPCRTETADREILRVFECDLAEGEEITLYKYMGIFSTNDLRPPAAPGRESRGPYPEPDVLGRRAAEVVSEAAGTEWEALREAHRAVWDVRWENLDIEIAGDDLAQTILRYNLYHNVIATPTHADHLPIGARGLSCQAYQGAAFWDQEIFNLPMFLFTDPATARNILVYRYRTLDGARKKAHDLGYRGAFYAWVSGDTGEEICPSYFFRDVISGRRIRNHFNDWQIHISPDIAYTIWKYVTVTGDQEYLLRYGAEIVFEIARFLISRVHYRKDLNRYEVIRVLGPDEYHENVDNNYFTNYQVRFAARYAVQVYDWMAENTPEEMDRIRRTIGLLPEERRDWEELGDFIFVPEPDPETGLIEQFQGFFDHEDVTPEQIRERLIDPGEYWGWPNGIAVETQVSKQADVTQLFVLHPDAEDRTVMKRNWEYYEPRTQHGSSLSYAVYAISAAWVGHIEEAYRYFVRSCTVDLYNTGKAVSGGTFIGGIHTAACGIAWQIVVNGFLGMEVNANGFRFAPHLPASWRRVRVPLMRRGARIIVDVDQDAGSISVLANRNNTEDVNLSIGDAQAVVAPGESVTLMLVG